MSESARAPRIRYALECRDRDGVLKWRDGFENLVTTQGQDYLLATGAASAIAKYMGLINGSSAPTLSAADTLASHAGWTEITGYSQTTRPAISWGAASGGSMASSAAVQFSITASATIAGAFTADNDTIGGTTGNLYSEGTFSGGNKAVASGDTLNVSVTLSA
jgi:hypothetical protein